MTLVKREFGWKFDFPNPDAAPEVKSTISTSPPPPGNFDQIYLELPCIASPMRGYFSVIGSLLVLISLTLIIITTYASLTALKADYETIILVFLLCAFEAYAIIPYIRIDLGMPRNEPIRFNRKRQKVYFYKYQFDRLHPFGRKGWGVKPVAYDWKDLTAEAYRLYAPMGYGGLVEKVMLSVCRSGSDEIIDRLRFADSIEKGEHYWNTARTFMQYGPGDIHLSDYTPDTLDRNDHPNLFHRLAPKVEWPIDMDLESRTAPGSGDKS